MSSIDFEDEVRTWIAARVREGYESRDDIVDGVADVFADSGDLSRIDTVGITAEALARHADAERSWTQSTDPDRLTSVFEGLVADGIVGRENFACCNSCGRAEIGDEIEVEQGRRPIHGYAFFHSQDTERVADDGSLYVSYGSVDGTEAGAVEVGKVVRDRLRDAGFQVDWNGSVETRIGIEGIDWKRRRATT